MDAVAESLLGISTGVLVLHALVLQLSFGEEKDEQQTLI
jgi:hypothetical protein